MRDWLVMALVAALCSSGGCWRQQLEAEVDASREELRSSVNSAVVTARCDDGRALGPGCGYLLERLAQEGIRSRFRGQHCRAVSDDDCQRRYEQTIHQLFRARYYAAAWGEVELSCGATRESCASMRYYELIVMGSHNAHVLSRAAEQSAEIERARREKEAELVQRDAAIATWSVGAILPGGGCHTYPSLIDGLSTTVCP